MKSTKKSRNKYFLLLLFVFIFILSACTPNPNFKSYKGKNLKIAVIGEPPKIENEQVIFKKISFDEMKSKDLHLYDAVFIMKKNLSKAAESQYADVYLDSTIPFFFFQSTKGYKPFIDKDLEYTNSSDVLDRYYVIGFLASKENASHKVWGYDLYNGVVNNKNKKEIYSRIFNTIEQNH